MYNLDDFFDKNTKSDHKSIDSNSGVLIDLKIWISAYQKHLVDTMKSLNTIELYNVTLDGLSNYTSRYLSELSGISKINVDHLNDFLDFMEQYEVSKRHGSIKERVSILLSFLSKHQIENVSDFRKAMSTYFVEMDDDVVDINEYVLNDFMDFYAHNMVPLGDNLIKSYINSRPKVSIKTMEQRRIALIAFLGFIDKSVGEVTFGGLFWQIKQYKSTKNVKKLSTGFSSKDDKKIRAALLSPLQYDLEQLKRVQNNSEYCEWRLRAMMTLMMDAGLRASEALGLRFADITVIDDDGCSGYFLRVIGKGNKERRVPISKVIFGSYLEYLTTHRRGEFLSSTESGIEMDRTNLYKVVRKKLLSAGVSKAGLHIFRHHFGSTFAASDGNMKLLQQLLGHSIITTTMIYSHVDDEVLARAVIKG